MTDLPPLRRIVTGHTADGKAIIESDTTLSPVDPRPDANKPSSHEDSGRPSVGGFINLWRTDRFPASIQGPWEDVYSKSMTLADKTGTTVRVVDMPPGVSSPMHRTVSLDFGIVLSGQVSMEVDDGVSINLEPGQVVVQRGTIHAWHNRGPDVARLFFVLLPSENVTVNGEKLEATKFEIN